MDVDIRPSDLDVQTYPNPNNGEFTISMAINKNGVYNMTIYNTLGQTVKSIFNNTQVGPGCYKRTVNFPYASGMYFAQLLNTATGERSNFKIVVAK